MLEGEEREVYNIYYDNPPLSLYTRYPLTKLTKLFKSVTPYITDNYMSKKALTKVLTIIDKNTQNTV